MKLHDLSIYTANLSKYQEVHLEAAIEEDEEIQTELIYLLSDIRFALAHTMHAVLALAGNKSKIELPSEERAREKQQQLNTINYLNNLTRTLK